MRAFTIKVTKCEECPNKRYSPEINNFVCGAHSGHADRIIYKRNRDGITPSCPMYASAKEVAE